MIYYSYLGKSSADINWNQPIKLKINVHCRRLRQVLQVHLGRICTGWNQVIF